MTKLALTDLTNLSNEQAAVTNINNNALSIETFSDTVLSRMGTAPNQMEADLDMNSNRILNLQLANTPTEPVRKAEFDAAVFGNINVVNGVIATQAEAEAGTLNSVLMTPLRTKQALLAQAINVAIEEYGGGTGVADNTTALMAAYNDAPTLSDGHRPIVINFGPGQYNFTQTGAITFARNGVFIKGAGWTSTRFKYTAAGTGTFLKWAAPTGITPLHEGGLMDLCIWCLEQTASKIAVEVEDVSYFKMDHVSIGEVFPNRSTLLWSGNGGPYDSIGLYYKGRDAGEFNHLAICADQPIVLGINPHSYLSQDHNHYHNLLLVSAPIATGRTNPNIRVQDGVSFTNTVFDGMQVWAISTHGFYYDEASCFNHVDAVTAGGANYQVGDLITTTVLMPGGSETVTTRAVVRVLAIGGGGTITRASIAVPGAYTVKPTHGGLVTGDVQQLSVTNSSGGASSGTGATFTLNHETNYGVKISNARKEQGQDAGSNDWTIHYGPSVKTHNITVDNCVFDANSAGGGCNGVRFKNCRAPTVRGCSYVFEAGTGVEAVSATTAFGNDSLRIDNCFFGLTNASIQRTGLSPVYEIYTSESADITSSPTNALYTILDVATVPATPTPGINARPFFSAVKAVTQSVPDNTSTVIVFPTEVYDYGSYFASNAWTPPAGIVTLKAGIGVTGTFDASNLDLILSIFKDGAVFQSVSAKAAAGGIGMVISVDDVASGSNVYDVRLIQQSVAAAAATVGSGAETYFSGMWYNQFKT